MRAVLAEQVVGDLPGRPVLCLLWDMAFHTPRIVLRPLLRHVQLRVHERAAARRRIRQKHSDLAIINLSESAAPLTRDADRVLALLWEARPIENENGVRVAQFLPDVTPHLLPKKVVLPTALPNEPLQATPRYIMRGSDRLDRLPLEPAHEALEIHLQVPLLLFARQQRLVTLCEDREMSEALRYLRWRDCLVVVRQRDRHRDVRCHRVLQDQPVVPAAIGQMAPTRKGSKRSNF